MLAEHISLGAAVTVAAVRVPRAQATDFGLIEVSGDRISAFREKPQRPEGLDDDPDRCLASMGNYVSPPRPSSTPWSRMRRTRATSTTSGPTSSPLRRTRRRRRLPLRPQRRPGGTEHEHGYWRDVGTLDAYYDAHMDLVYGDPRVQPLQHGVADLLLLSSPLPPAKFVFDDEQRRGTALDSIVSPGVIVSGGMVRRSVLESRGAGRLWGPRRGLRPHGRGRDRQGSGRPPRHHRQAGGCAAGSGHRQ